MSISRTAMQAACNLSPCFISILLLALPGIAQVRPGEADSSSAAGTVIKSDKLKTMPEIPGLSDPFQLLFYNTLKLSLERDDEMKDIDSKLAKFRDSFKDKKNPSAEALVAHKEGIACIEGSAALIERKEELRSYCAAELAWEKKIDERFLTLLKLFSVIAESLGSDASNQLKSEQEQLKSVQSQMQDLLGESESNALFAQLNQLRSKMVPKDPAKESGKEQTRAAFSAIEYSKKLEQLEFAIQDSDPILKDLIGQLDQQSQSKDTGTTHRFLSNSLNVLSFVPGGVGDVAGYAQMAYDMGSGAEDAKLLHSVYLYKRAEIRKRVISESAVFIIHNYESAVQSGNQFLLAFARSQISDLAGAKTLELIEAMKK